MGSDIHNAARIDVSPVAPGLTNQSYGNVLELNAASISDGCVVRPNVLLYRGTRLGKNVFVGDGAIVRENVVIGDDTVIGAGVVVENNCTIGARTKVMTRAYICAYSTVGDDCFVGPMCCFTNDRYAGHPSVDAATRVALRKGPVLKDRVTLGAMCLLWPGVELASGVFVGAGQQVMKSITEPGMYFLRSVNPARQRDVGFPEAVLDGGPAEDGAA